MRSSTGSATSATRASSRKPVTLPISAPSPGLAGATRYGTREMRLRAASRDLALLGRCRLQSRGLSFVQLGESALIFVREHLHELAAYRVPVVEKRKRPRAAGKAQMPFDQLPKQRRVGSSHVAQPTLSCRRKLALQLRLIDLFQHRLERHHRKIAAPRERAVVVVDESHATAHSRREIAPGSAENHHGAARHVLAAMVSCSLDNRGRTGVTYAKTLAGDAAEVCFALDRTVHHGVADHDVVLRPRRRLGV